MSIVFLRYPLKIAHFNYDIYVHTYVVWIARILGEMLNLKCKTIRALHVRMYVYHLERLGILMIVSVYY